MWVRVTALDIKRGRQRQSAGCPVARAVRRAFRYRGEASVGATSGNVFLGLGRARLYFRLPPAAQAFIKLFDFSPYVLALAWVKPFSFQIRTLPAGHLSAFV